MSYEVVMELASGGMGRVYLGCRRAGRFERWVAVKRMHPHLLDEVEMREMFLEEARLAGLLRHVNVVSVIDVGSDDEGPFLVMDFVDGLSLRHVLAHHAQIKLPIPLQAALRIGAQVCAGLHAAHDLVNAEGEPLRLVHRDVSPANVLVGFDGVARLTDFGVAKALDQSHRTATGVVKGKSSYMSPEQFRFERVDRRSDLFSFGILLFQLVSGRHPFGSVNAERPRRILLGDCEDLGEHHPDAPAALVELCYELLANDPSDRPESARAVQLRLDALVGELEALEGPLQIVDYLESAFPNAKRESEDARRLALANRPPDRTQPPKKARTARLVLLAVFVMAIAGAVGVAGLLFGGFLRSEQIPDRAGEARASSSQEPIAASDVVSAQVSTDAGVEPDSGTPARRARGRRGARKGAASMSSAGPQLWGWER